MKSINQPYKNGQCRSCIHCQQGNTCSVNGKGGTNIPCIAVHACNKYYQQDGQNKIDIALDKLNKTKLLDKDMKKSITNRVTNYLHRHAEKRVARATRAEKKA